MFFLSVFPRMLHRKPPWRRHRQRFWSLRRIRSKTVPNMTRSALTFHLQRFSNQGSLAKTVDALQNVLLPGRSKKTSQDSMAAMAQQMGWMMSSDAMGIFTNGPKGILKIHIARIDDIPPRLVYNIAKTIFSNCRCIYISESHEPLWFRRACPWAHHCKISIILLCPGRGSNTPDFTDVYSNYIMPTSQNLSVLFQTSFLHDDSSQAQLHTVCNLEVLMSTQDS